MVHPETDDDFLNYVDHPQMHNFVPSPSNIVDHPLIIDIGNVFGEGRRISILVQDVQVSDLEMLLYAPTGMFIRPL